MNNTWDTRIRRALELSSVYPFAAEGLRFYAQVAMLQQKLYSQLERSPAPFLSLDGSLSEQLHSPALLPQFPSFLLSVRQIAPSVLAQVADGLAQKGYSSWLHLLEDFCSSSAIMERVEPGEDLLAERCLGCLFLQPFAEYWATQQTRRPVEGSPARCPCCGAKPIVGVLRPEGEGAKKSLVCMLCAHEWSFRRIYCPSCGEEREPHLAFYSAPEIPHVRVDVCDTCRAYLKTVDLTKTGLAVPPVDELAAIPLDLWAHENGYWKLQRNTVGI